MARDQGLRGVSAPNRHIGDPFVAIAPPVSWGTRSAHGAMPRRPSTLGGVHIGQEATRIA